MCLVHAEIKDSALVTQYLVLRELLHSVSSEPHYPLLPIFPKLRIEFSYLAPLSFFCYLSKGP